MKTSEGDGPKTGKRGFASMSPERRREVARNGGLAVPKHKRSFARDRTLAATAGKKGGATSRGGGRPRKPEQ